ncbi:MAG: hypothetical protein WDW38_002963 [Sanguina aurantia]
MRCVSAPASFNLGATKSRVFKALDVKVPGPFRKFFNSPLYDRLLQSSLLYFVARFMHDWLTKAMDKARKMHFDSYNPHQIAARLHDLEQDMEVHRMELSPTYSEIILKHSTYEKPQQDNVGDEAQIDALTRGPGGPRWSVRAAHLLRRAKRSWRVLMPDGHTDRCGGRGILQAVEEEEVEAEIGALFRTRHFNINQRKNQPARSVDTLSVKELYSLKHETTNRALNAKMLSSLYEKPPTLGVQSASVSNSPLITQFISSPIVARSKTKDQTERRSSGSMKLHHFLPGGTAPDTWAGFGTGTSVADMKGTTTMAAPKADPLKMAPSTYSVDDAFQHLALLKRYLMHGPTLGLAAGGGGGGINYTSTPQQQQHSNLGCDVSSPVLGGMPHDG